MRFELPAEKKLVHQMVVPTRWGDMDTMGHINNTLYFRFMEIVRMDWVLGMGVSTDLSGEGIVIVNAFCNFLRQVEYPGDLDIKLYVAEPGRSSFMTYHTMARTDAPDVVCAEGGARTVWTDFSTRKSAPLPDWLREKID
ncbi:MAG: thioesterase family protein [Rubrivivax sp.]